MGRASGRGFAAILVVAVLSGSAAAARPPGSRLIVRATDGSWHGVLLANPARSGCRRIALPDPDVFAFAIARNRVAYPSNSGRVNVTCRLPSKTVGCGGATWIR